MIGMRARLWAFYHLLWVFVLFGIGVYFMRWALEIGLSYFFMVLPEWVMWVYFCTTVLNFFKERRIHRRSHQTSDNIYWYSHSEPRYIGQFVEELCLMRRWQLPHIVIVEDSNQAEMIDDIQRPDLLILKKSTVNSLSEKELKGVIAHELRHSDATDTKLIYLFFIMYNLFARLWLLGGITYILFSHEAILMRLWGIVWGVSLYLLVRVVGKLLLLAMIRSMEYKTDILAALDTREPEQLLSAILSLTNQGGYELFNVRKKSSFFMSIILDWLTSVHLSHPTYAQRHRSLERVFGELRQSTYSSGSNLRLKRSDPRRLNLVEHHSA